MKSFDWLAQRNLAETVVCPQCHVGPGATCRNQFTDRELAGPPAHHPRLVAAEQNRGDRPTVTPSQTRPESTETG